MLWQCLETLKPEQLSTNENECLASLALNEIVGEREGESEANRI